MWELAPSDRALALETEAGLRKAVGPPDVEEALPQIDRLEHLRGTWLLQLIAHGHTPEQAASAAAVHAAWKPAHAAGLDVFAADAGI
ncbi:hypothetical protein [Streptomyces sp. PanSC9]|uniref:hypothetical protein n=1 Tax=Streptomyces sp. PanSC9 TaxID=1520461 RepID=UPI000FA4C35C|nr:hypothetical protein [Streptomyces sp. PanSC9]ROP47965.1 hypothetical protein EDD94_7686 [Streptomyces sp. PanSC9]